MKKLIIRVNIIVISIFIIIGCTKDIRKSFEHNLFKEHYFEYKRVPSESVILGDFNGDEKLDWGSISRFGGILMLFCQDKKVLDFNLSNIYETEKNNIPVVISSGKIYDKLREDILLLEYINTSNMRRNLRLNILSQKMKFMKFKKNVVYSGDIEGSIITKDINNDGKDEVILLRNTNE